MHLHRLSLVWSKALPFLTLILTLSTHARAVSTEKVLYTFTGGNDGGLPVAGLIFDASGNLYGTTGGGGSPTCEGGNGCGTVFELTAKTGGGWTEKVLYTFTGGSDGWAPEIALIFDSNGNLYGTALAGGNNVACTLGCGTVFELRPNGDGTWTETTIHSFAGGRGGQSPNAPLIFDQSGNLYGTTYYGGGASCNVGCGTVFELTPNAGRWTHTVLHRFTGNDGANPRGGVILDKAGDLYGTTEGGGGNGCSGHGCGTVFRLRRSTLRWKESVLYRFSGDSDGAFPEAGLVQDMAGNLYGTTDQGGDMRCSVFGGAGCGTVFKMHSSNGKWKQSVLHSFAGGKDGTNPLGGVIFYNASLFGMTNVGGGNGCNGGNGCGTVFELKHSKACWREKILHRFTGGKDGSHPVWGSPVFDAAGNLYGTTSNGGPDDQGTVFEATP
jgi:uncharacterized repeat protein (TIGR03803 family)